MIREVFNRLLTHFNKLWAANSKEIFEWTHGPAKKALPDLRVCQIEPIDREEPWIYITMGASDVGDDKKNGLEFIILSPCEDNIHIETLAVTAFYHIDYPLKVGKVIDIGRGWMDNSKLHHFLVSLPYPYGPEFELCQIMDRCIRFLWLLPITESEALFVEQHGLEALESIFDEKEINPVDINRKSVV